MPAGRAPIFTGPIRSFESMLRSVSHTRIEPIGKPRRTLSSNAVKIRLLPYEGPLEPRNSDLAGRDAIYETAEEHNLRADFCTFWLPKRHVATLPRGSARCHAQGRLARVPATRPPLLIS